MPIDPSDQAAHVTVAGHRAGGGAVVDAAALLVVSDQAAHVIVAGHRTADRIVSNTASFLVISDQAANVIVASHVNLDQDDVRDVPATVNPEQSDIILVGPADEYIGDGMATAVKCSFE